jgi:hypothetical protein
MQVRLSVTAHRPKVQRIEGSTPHKQHWATLDLPGKVWGRGNVVETGWSLDSQGVVGKGGQRHLHLWAAAHPTA